MHITTVHTLSFTIRCNSNDQQLAAMAIIKTGAANMGLTTTVNAMALPENEVSSTRNFVVQAMAPEHDTCEHYWTEVQRALGMTGVEATSP